MLNRKAIGVILALALAGSISVEAQVKEQSIVDQYLQKSENMHVRKLGWVSLNFGVNRINRNNDYNTFATIESALLDGASLSWLSQAYSFGADFGVVLHDKFTWSLGGEYWLNLGESFDGTFNYFPSGGLPATITDLQSKISVYGGYTGFGYYVINPPSKSDQLRNLAVKVGGTVGLYLAKWNLWQDYQNLNLSTSQPANVNTTFQGTAPGFTIDLGVEYPVGIWNLAAVIDINYLYLNFGNIAWYNSNDEEIIVSWDGTDDGRVDLTFSGFRGKFEMKRFFSW
jgi:hypothetical protein